MLQKKLLTKEEEQYLQVIRKWYQTETYTPIAGLLIRTGTTYENYGGLENFLCKINNFDKQIN